MTIDNLLLKQQRTQIDETPINLQTISGQQPQNLYEPQPLDNPDDWYERQITDPILAQKIQNIDREAEEIMKASLKYIKPKESTLRVDSSTGNYKHQDAGSQGEEVGQLGEVFVEMQ